MSERTPPGLEAHPTVDDLLAMSEGITPPFYDFMEYLVFCCEVDEDGRERPEQAIRRLLETRIREFERKDGWVAENPAMQAMAVQYLRKILDERPKRKRGAPQKKLARQLLGMVTDGLQSELQRRGATYKAASLLDGGQEAHGWDGPAKPTGLNTAVGVATVVAERAGVRAPGLKQAAEDVRRAQRKKREKNPATRKD